MKKIYVVALTSGLAICGGSALAQFVDDTQVLHTHTGSGLYGWAVSELTDINGDGITDYIIGATGVHTTEVYSGADSQLLHRFRMPGSSLGYAMADAGDVDNDGVNDIITSGPLLNGSRGVAVVYSGATGNLIWRFDGEQANDRFGSAVAAAGDVNGDGFADLLVGAESYAPNNIEAGRVYVYSGQDGQLIRTLDAQFNFDRFGGGVGLLGDLNQDGINEHIVGAYDAGVNRGGKAYVHSGVDGSLLFELLPDAGASAYAQFFVASAGDVDDDGTDDIYVADYNHGGGAGRVYIYSGASQQILHRFSGLAGEGLGPGRRAGDVNGDGHADLIVGSYLAGPNQAGKVTVFSGADGSELQVMQHNLANSQLGFDAIGLGDVNQDGKDDHLLSAANGNVVYLVAGNVSKPDNQAFSINPGLSGAWGIEGANSQGLMFDINDQLSFVFGAWFTYVNNPDSQANSIPFNGKTIGAVEHGWLTAYGSYSGDQAELTLALSSDGLFMDPSPTGLTEVGTAELTFIDCLHGSMNYDLAIPGGLVESGQLNLYRLTPDRFCQKPLKALVQPISFWKQKQAGDIDNDRMMPDVLTIKQPLMEDKP